MSYREDLKYTQDHEWIRIDGEQAYVGITEYAASQLGDIVFVELPEEDAEIGEGDVLCNIESVKAVAEVYCPLSGVVVQINSDLEDAPEKINEAPYDAWLAVLKISEIGECMDASAYSAYVEGL